MPSSVSPIKRLRLLFVLSMKDGKTKGFFNFGKILDLFLGLLILLLKFKKILYKELDINKQEPI